MLNLFDRFYVIGDYLTRGVRLDTFGAVQESPQSVHTNFWYKVRETAIILDHYTDNVKDPGKEAVKHLI